MGFPTLHTLLFVCKQSVVFLRSARDIAGFFCFMPRAFAPQENSENDTGLPAADKSTACGMVFILAFFYLPSSRKAYGINTFSERWNTNEKTNASTPAKAHIKTSCIQAADAQKGGSEESEISIANCV